MQAEELSKRLLNYTITHSGLEVRTFLGMSRIGACPRVLYLEMVHGRAWTTDMRLYCHLDYMFKRSILDRLKAINPRLLGPSQEFSDFGGRFCGHTGGSWDSDLLEIKSMLDVRLPTNGRIPHNYFWQIQTYMRYGGYKQAQVVCIARDTGRMTVVPVRFNQRIADLAHLKAASVLEAVGRRKPPECECGHCI